MLIQRVCSGWKHAVSNEHWKRIAFLQFPHLHQLMSLLNVASPCYRALYRDQYAAIIPAAAPALQSGERRMKKFVFTIELNWESCPISFSPDDTVKKITWVGHAKNIYDTVGCDRLWDEPPKWVNALETLDDIERVQAMLHEHLKMTIFVSKASETGMRTIRLCNRVPLSDLDIDSKLLIFDNRDSTLQLPLAQSLQVTLFENINLNLNMRPRICYETNNGEIDEMFCGENDNELFFYNMDEIADYLEHLL